ncbi:DUF6069 family protein [Pseudolysinimonas sp.]|uniref:DUF6069 family protein n=1 Tax=Pseudolysinimonas sp. TaxID=2680009 RepID=UPI003F80FDA3
MSDQTSVRRPLGPSWLLLDLPAGSAQPRWWRWLVASVVAVVVSVAACWAVAAATAAAFPSTAGYDHFQFADYAKLTIAGVAVAAVVWPLATLLSTRARRLYLVLAVLGLVASFVPDLWILYRGQPLIGVLALAIMHVAVGAVTVAALLGLAPQRRRH